MIKPPGAAAAGTPADNRKAFRRFYSEAIVDAQTAHQHIGIPNEQRRRDGLDRSGIAVGFAEHYIMGAFRAGQPVNRDDFGAVLQSSLPGRASPALFQPTA